LQATLRYYNISLFTALSRFLSGLWNHVLSEPISVVLLASYIILILKNVRQVNLRQQAFIILCLLGTFAAVSPTAIFVTGWTVGYMSYGIPISLLLGNILLLRRYTDGPCKRIWPALAAVFIVWQVVWLFSYRFNNLVALSQYFTGQTGILSLLPKYIMGFIEQPLYAYFDDSLHLLNMRQLNAYMASCDWSSFPEIVFVGQKNGIKRYIGSLVLCAYLLIPYAILLFMLLFYKLKVNARRAALSAFCILFAIVSMVFKFAGKESVEFKKTAIELNSSMVNEASYSFILPPELIAYANERGFVQARVYTGTARTAIRYKAEIAITPFFSTRAQTDIYAKEPYKGTTDEEAYSKVELDMSLLTDGEGGGRIDLRERFTEPLSYFWAAPRYPHQDKVDFAATGFSPFLEVRFFDKNGDVGLTYLPRYEMKPISLHN
jgi:hypothetical protein